MEDQVQQRLKKYISLKGWSARDFEKETGLGNGTCASICSATRNTTFDRISKACPDLNIDWLRTGEGEMTKPCSQSAGNVSGHNVCGVNINGREIHITCPNEYDTLLEIVREYKVVMQKYQSQLDKSQQQIDELITLLKAKL